MGLYLPYRSMTVGSSSTPSPRLYFLSGDSIAIRVAIFGSLRHLRGFLQKLPDAQLRTAGSDNGLIASDGSKWKKREEFIRDRLPGALSTKAAFARWVSSPRQNLIDFGEGPWSLWSVLGMRRSLPRRSGADCGLSNCCGASRRDPRDCSRSRNGATPSAGRSG